MMPHDERAHFLARRKTGAGLWTHFYAAIVAQERARQSGTDVNAYLSPALDFGRSFPWAVVECQNQSAAWSKMARDELALFRYYGV